RGATVTTVRGTGTLVGVEADLSLMPDAAMTLGVLACFATGRTVLTGLRTLRDKECDRIDAMEAEFTKLGARIEAGADRIAIEPGAARADDVEIETYDDHRMAMALALAGLRRPGVRLRDPSCVNKTYPGFWSDLARLYG
ncbi:MAG: hypothetical protein KDA28_13435, partial [Phycisphaerales bacterium]|nr:hypothetical protein [Phycisphaerales bacterium]